MRVLHLAGSPTSDFFADLSRLYAADCLEATASPRLEPVVAWVSPDGSWRFPRDLSPAAIADAEPLPVATALAHLSVLDVDVALPQMFCLPGMTTYRSLLDLVAIPYVGNTPDVMALAAHKQRAKAVVAGAGVRVPEGEVVLPGARVALDPPVVVKPVDSDNSMGLTLVRERSAYDAAVREACEHGSAALVETYVELGREVRCGIVERDGELLALPLEEYAVSRDAKPVRDRHDKLAPAGGPGDSTGDRGLRLVAKDTTRAWLLGTDDPATAPVQEAARRCHQALGCRHYGLFDFRIDPDGEPWFLEAGLYNSFARQSVVTMMADAAGIDLPDLLADAIDQALGTPHQEASHG